MPSRTLLTAALALSLTACEASSAVPRRDGRFVWSAADVSTLTAARRTQPALAAGVWIATIGWDVAARVPRSQLALAPTAPGLDTVVAVIRFDPSMDAAWEALDDDDLTRLVELRCAAILQAVKNQPVAVGEIVLDYDAPAGRLPRYALLVGRLGHGVFEGHPLWITSRVAHLREAGFGAAFRHRVDGQVLQVDDAGEPATPTAITEISTLLRRTDLPFRLAVQSTGNTRQDSASSASGSWLAAAPALDTLPGWRGLWRSAAASPGDSATAR